MSDTSTKQLLEMYQEKSSAPLFLTSFFKNRKTHNSEKVEIDVLRDDDDIALPLPSTNTGPRMNEAAKYTNKSFTPPVYDEAVPLSSYKLNQRRAGQDPFQDPDFAANATEDALAVITKVENKILRSIELQASQVFQTGVLALTDALGNNLFPLDFQAKSSHFVTTTPWAADGSTGDPIGDIEAMGVKIRRDGKKRPTRLIFGAVAWQRFYANVKVKATLDNRAMEFGRLVPQNPSEDGASFMGVMAFGQYKYELWCYDGFFRAPGDSAYTPYVGDNKVIMLSDGARMDLAFGTIPLFPGATDERVMGFLPEVFTGGASMIPLTTLAYFTENRKSLVVSAGVRPLCIPTAIDSFGCLTVA